MVGLPLQLALLLVLAVGVVASSCQLHPRDGQLIQDLPLGTSDTGKILRAGLFSVEPERSVVQQTEGAGPGDASAVLWQDKST